MKDAQTEKVYLAAFYLSFLPYSRETHRIAPLRIPVVWELYPVSEVSIACKQHNLLPRESKAGDTVADLPTTPWLNHVWDRSPRQMFIGVFENQTPRTELLFQTNHGYNTCEPGEPRSLLKKMCDSQMPQTGLLFFNPDPVHNHTTWARRPLGLLKRMRDNLTSLRRRSCSFTLAMIMPHERQGRQGTRSLL